jgi:hypothetical protein
VQFALSGSWSQPQIRFDYQPMVQFLTQRSLLREQLRVEAAQALIIEKQRLKREADYYAARAEARKRQRIEAEEAVRKRAEEAAGSGTLLPQEQPKQQGVTPDFKPNLDEFLQTLPETTIQ